MASYSTEIGALSRILELFVAQEGRIKERKECDISASRCLVFTTIAGNDGRMSAADLGKEGVLNMRANIMSRHIQALSEWERPGRPGLNLIEQRVDPHDTRRKLLFLTPTGRDFAEKLIGTVNGERTVHLDTRGPDAVMRQRWDEAAAKQVKRP